MSDDATRRDGYRHFETITTRWMDNDLYGHVNNVTYYSYFDTVANSYLIHQGGLDIVAAPVIGVVVSSNCEYRKSLAYPQRLDAGLRVDRLGTSSVTYGIGIFAAGDAEVSAFGRFVHVFVERASQRPVPIPGPIRAALEQIRVDG
ncbi:MAG TPA: thioesterase family protein [Gammaproteobacteria bacterium]